MQQKTMSDSELWGPLHRLTMTTMVRLNGLAHLFIGLGLAGAVVMFTWLFVVDVERAFRAASLAQGFLHALGTLLLLWTVSALISAEIRYLRGNPLTVDTFVEVALVVIVRKLISLPVQEVAPAPLDYLAWVGAALLLGVLYLVVRLGQGLAQGNSST